MAGIAATPGIPKQAVAGMIGASKASSYGKSKTSDVEGAGKVEISSQGIAMIADFELSEGSAKKWGIGEFDTYGKMIGIYPHYVFKNIGTQDNLQWVSDGGITFGHGIYVTKSMYDSDQKIKKWWASMHPELLLFLPLLLVMVFHTRYQTRKQCQSM